MLRGLRVDFDGFCGRQSMGESAGLGDGNESERDRVRERERERERYRRPKKEHALLFGKVNSISRVHPGGSQCSSAGMVKQESPLEMAPVAERGDLN